MKVQNLHPGGKCLAGVKILPGPSPEGKKLPKCDSRYFSEKCAVKKGHPCMGRMGAS